MTTFKYIGESPNGLFEMYGFSWENGTAHNVTEETAIRKLSGNRFFERADTEGEGKKGRKKGKDHGNSDTGAVVESGDGEAGPK